MSAYSYIIKGGTIIDGSGFPKAKGDIGISGETIKTVGNIWHHGALRIIDATGKYVMPGFIDITNHSDTHWTLLAAPSQESLLAQGITTIVGGVCGSSLAPLVDPGAIRAIQKWTDISEVNINWKSQGEFFEELERHHLGINFGTLVGHGTLRRGITGDDPRPLERPELESMKLLLRRSLDEGALGLSFHLGSSHGMTVPQDEIIQLARVVAESGKIVSLHLRSEGRRLLSSVVEAINIARSSGASVQISHFKAIGRKAWQDLSHALNVIRKAKKEENLSIWIDIFPYLRTGSLLYTFLPAWMLEGGKDHIIGLLGDGQKRAAVLESIESLTLHYDNIIIASAKKDKSSIGKTLAHIAADTGLRPEEVLIQVLIVNDLAVTIFSKTLLSKHLVTLAREPYSMFGSDGVGRGTKNQGGDLDHPRSYGASPRWLARLVTKSGILTWEEAVKKMTSLPASRLGLETTRGMIKEGYFADIVICDPATLADTATYQEPVQYPAGIDYVFVNGHIAIEKGTTTGALAGKILRRG